MNADTISVAVFVCSSGLDIPKAALAEPGNVVLAWELRHD